MYLVYGTAVQKSDIVNNVSTETNENERDHSPLAARSVEMSTTRIVADDAVVVRIPHVPVFVDDETGRIEKGSRLVLEHIRPEWDLDKVRYKLFTDGITNKLIGVFNDSCPEDDGVLVRVYGRNTDRIIDRKSEFQNFKLLNRAGFAPDIYATFDNGMAYKYIRGETLTTTTVRDPSVYRLVARSMAKCHRLDVSDYFKTTEPGLWSKIEQFADLIPERFSSPSTDLQFRSTFTQGIKGLRADIETLKVALKSIDSPVVFCHNDLLLSNIILQKDTAGGQPVNVVFIDYEYAMLNYQAFDIANHFVEFAGVQEPNFSLFPNVELQLDWLTSYLQEYLGEPQIDRNDPRVATIREQVDLFVISSHLLWTFWALVQAELSKIDFDYLSYAKMRFEQFSKTKKLLDK